ncbi:unnamed protein product [Lepidochelys kempii]
MGLSTLPARLAGSDRSSRFITSRCNKSIAERSPGDSGTSPEREVQAESTGERQLSTYCSEDTRTAKPLQRLSIKHKSIKLFGDFIRSHVHWSSIETKKYSNPMTAKSNFMWSLKTWQAGKVTYKDNCPEAG